MWCACTLASTPSGKAKKNIPARAPPTAARALQLLDCLAPLPPAAILCAPSVPLPLVLASVSSCAVLWGGSVMLCTLPARLTSPLALLVVTSLPSCSSTPAAASAAHTTLMQPGGAPGAGAACRAATTSCNCLVCRPRVSVAPRVVDCDAASPAAGEFPHAGRTNRCQSLGPRRRPQGMLHGGQLAKERQRMHA
jgi:hypothetical protein